MATSIADLFVSVSADVSGAVAGLTTLTTELDATNASLLTATPAMLALAAAATAIDAAMISAVSSAADFEAQLNAVRNNTTMTDDDMSTMRDTINTIGSQSPVAFDNLAQGFMHVSNSGFDAADSATILDAAMKSAVSTSGDTAATASVLAAVLHEFGMNADDAASTMDKLHIASAEGKMTLEQFSNSFGQLAAWAAAVGVPLDEAAAAMSAMTRHGFDSAEAAVQVKDQIEHIIKPSTAATKAMKELSQASGEDVVQAFSSTFLHANGLTGVMDLVTNAMDRAGLTADQQTAMWLKLVPNIRGGAASFVLAGRGAADFRSILGDMNNSLGVTEAAFARTQETTKFKWGTLINQFDILRRTIGDELKPEVNKLIDGLSGLVKQFQAMSPEMKQTFAYVAVGAAAFIGLVLPMLLISAVLGPMIGSFLALGGILLAAVPPFLALAAVAGMLWVAWQRDLGGIQEFAHSVFDQIPTLLGQAHEAFGALQQGVSDLGDAFGPKINNVLDVFGGLVTELVTTKGPLLLDFFTTQLSTALDTFQSKMKDAGPTLTTVGGFFNAFGQLLDTLTVAKVKTAADAFSGGFGEGLSKFGNQVAPLVPVFTAIGGFAVGLNNLIQAFNNLKSRSAGGAGTEQITDPIQQFLDFITSHGDQLTSVQSYLGPLGPLFALIRDNSAGIADFFNSLASALNNLAAAMDKLSGTDVPPWLSTFLNKGLVGGVADLGFQTGTDIGKANAPAVAGSWNPAGPGAPLIQIGSLVISNEAERQAFLDEMATRIAAAAGRVLPPPDNSGNPRLAAGST